MLLQVSGASMRITVDYAVRNLCATLTHHERQTCLLIAGCHLRAYSYTNTQRSHRTRLRAKPMRIIITFCLHLFTFVVASSSSTLKDADTINHKKTQNATTSLDTAAAAAAAATALTTAAVAVAAFHFVYRVCLSRDESVLVLISPELRY